MTRSTLSAANRTEINLNRVGSVQLLALEFPSGTLYTCTGSKAFDYAGDTYLPDGKVLSVGGLSERGDGSQDPLVVLLNGVDEEIYAALADDWHYSLVRLYQLFVDEEHVEVGDPHELGAYYMSHASERTGKDECTVELTCENVLYSEGARVDAVLCEHALHLARSPNDTYFANVLALIDREVIWAGRVQSTGGAHGGGIPSGPGVINLPHNPTPSVPSTTWVPGIPG